MTDIPTKVSDLNNDSGFIDNTVNNLTNYYKKNETYTQEEVNSLISAISTMNMLVVQTLPTQDISTTTIYLLPRQTSETNNIYDEYIYVSNSWEKIGSTDVDLSNYYTKSQVDNLINNIDLSSYYTKTQTDTLIGAKQDTLVSGTNIKTINNESILGSGNITVGGNEIYIGDEQDAPATTKLLIDDEYVDFEPNIAEEIYSTEETKVGKWIDGKPLYRKTVYINSLPNNSAQIYTLFTNESEIDNVWLDEGKSFLIISNLRYCINWYWSNTAIFFSGIADKKLRIASNENQSSNSGFFTINYTKTTDIVGGAN